MDSAVLDVWAEEPREGKDPADMLGIETVEAEVVFLLRQKLCQWPEYQTEIHFHPSGPVHRELARRILLHYTLHAG